MNDKPNAKPDKPGLFITGTDTGVGKTHVAAMIVRALVAAGHKVGVYKPAASGCRRDETTGRLVSDDAVALWEASGRFGDFDCVCPQCFAAPLAPHLAAQKEGRKLDAELLRFGVNYWRERSDIVIVEGAGGLFSPLGDEELNIDLALELGWPTVIVTANRLGTIHAALATYVGRYEWERVEKNNRIAWPCLVLNDVTPDDGVDPSRNSNGAELTRRLKRYGAIEFVQAGYAEKTFRRDVDWLRMASYRPGWPEL